MPSNGQPGSSGKEKAKAFAQDFTWNSVIGKLDRLYRNVAAGREYQENDTEFVPLIHEHPSL
jgi:hypothetical protein